MMSGEFCSVISHVLQTILAPLIKCNPNYALSVLGWYPLKIVSTIA